MLIKDSKGNSWECIPASEAKERFIGRFDIAGDVPAKPKGTPIRTFAKTDSEGREQILEIYPFNERISFTEKVVGYIPCEDVEKGTVYARVTARSLAKVLVPLLIILALIAGCVTFFVLRGHGPDLDKAAISYRMPEGAGNTDPTKLSLPFFSKVNVKGTEGETVFPNPDGNGSYFRYVLVLEDDTTVYRSGLIEPGMAVAEWKLDTELNPGDYPATLQIQTFSLDDHTQQTNGGNMSVVLHVE